MGASNSKSFKSSAAIHYNDGRNGGNWTNKVYLDLDADSGDGELREISDRELRRRMSFLIEQDESIQNIRVYKCPIWSWQPRGPVAPLCHQFLVFETEDWWWSMEKNDKGITIQRGKRLSSVRDLSRGKSRVPDIVLISCDEGRKSVKHLVDWLYREDELNKPYHHLSDNCHAFAKRVFDEFAKSKYHYILG